MRTLHVTEPLGMHFDLVTAQIENPVEQDVRRLDRQPPSATDATGGTAQVPKSDAAQRDPRLVARSPSSDPHELSLPACANTIEIDDVTSIGAHVTVTLLTPVRLGEPLAFSAPRGEIPKGVFLALRYFDVTGARRGIMRVDSIRSRLGMLDEISGSLICPPTRAPERQFYRAPFTDLLTMENTSRGGRTALGQLIDLSADGIGFRMQSELAPGDRIRIADRELKDLDGAELVVVRRDGRDLERYGARFTEPDRGAATLIRRLDLTHWEHARLRQGQIEEIRRTREAAAGPLSVTDVRRLPNGRMRTRGAARQWRTS